MVVVVVAVVGIVVAAVEVISQVHTHNKTGCKNVIKKYYDVKSGWTVYFIGAILVIIYINKIYFQHQLGLEKCKRLFNENKSVNGITTGTR